MRSFLKVKVNLRTLAISSAMFVATGVQLQAAMSVTLNQSLPSPAPLGTVVHWSAAVPDSTSRTLWYRFRSRASNTGFHTIVDYGPNNSLDWTEIQREGAYQVEVSVQDKKTGEIATAVSTFGLISRVMNSSDPVISTTQNPLVFLYSAPGCAAGGRMRVQFTSTDGIVETTPYQPCHGATSMNYYLAGLRSQAQYSVQHTLDTGDAIVQGPILMATTPAISLASPQYQVYTGSADASPGDILLQCALYVPMMATDLSGNVIWYYDAGLTPTRAVAGGYFMGIFELATVDSPHQYLKKFDLVGTTIAETNAARVSEQLTAMGKRPIDAFHHEARALPGGKYLVLADNEQILTDVQGPGPVDVVGDEILVLDSNLQVIWAWDAFDHLDASRAAVLGEVCPSGAGCAPFYQAATSTDWLHGNSLQLTPDGNILYSSRHQDWLIKINYDNGIGDGSVLWRLGKDGDFTIISSDPSPWFSHQHDANLTQTDQGTFLTVFDDGNTRRIADSNANSRGQVYQLDEQSRTAKLVLNVDLGAYAFALGAAQTLPNGNVHFDVGWITDDPVGGANQAMSYTALP
jgi:arylsulfate sulfotransferase